MRVVVADVLLDVRLALRTLSTSRAFAVTTIATLAIGIAINATIFSIASGVLYSGFRSIEGNDRMLYIGTQKDGRGCCVSYADFIDWQAQLTSFEGLAAVADVRVAVNDGRNTESYIGTEITANAFGLLGQSPIAGRDFAASDTAAGAAPVAILSHRLWTRRFSANPAVLGQVVRINGVPTTIVGVMGEGFRFPQNQDLWLPLVHTSARQDRANRSLWFAFGRMRPGVDVERARSELATIGSRLERAYGTTNEGWRPDARTFAEFFISRSAPTTYRAMWGAAGFVLLIACANLANLMLARAGVRSGEFKIRLALGANRWRLVRQLMTESLVLSSFGAVFGWMLAIWAVNVYARWANPPGRLWSENLVAYTIDTRATIYIAGITVAAGIAIGLAPAWRLASTSRGNLIDAGGRSGTLGRAAGRFVGALVVTELALAVVLLSGAGALTRSFANKSAAPLGIDPANTLAMLVNLPQQAYSEPSTRIAFFDRLQTRLSAIPGVQSVSTASALPTGNGQPLVYESAGSPNSKDPQTVSSLTVGPQYFASFGVSLLAGRDFNSADSDNSTKVVIVNRAFAETEWPGQDPLGRQLWTNRQRSDSRIVVGVAPDILQGDPYRTRGHFEPVVYLPFRQRPIPNVWVLARTNTPLAVTASFRRELQSLDPDLAAWLGPLTVEEHIAGYGNYWIIGATAVLFLVFSIVGVVLAAIGLYGVVAQSMRQRTREIGVRMAIGARPADVLMLVLSRALWQVSLGLAAGLALAPFLTRLLGSYLGDVSPADPTTMGLACLVLTVSVVCACVIPVRRSLRIDPVVVLKTD